VGSETVASAETTRQPETSALPVSETSTPPASFFPSSSGTPQQSDDAKKPGESDSVPNQIIPDVTERISEDISPTKAATSLSDQHTTPKEISTEEPLLPTSQKVDDDCDNSTEKQTYEEGSLLGQVTSNELREVSSALHSTLNNRPVNGVEDTQ